MFLPSTLASNLPELEPGVLPDDFFDVGSDGRRRLDHLVHQELVEDGRLAGVVQPDDADLVF